MKHPRASELPKLIDALEKSGRAVAAVVVRWEQVDGREVPCWEIRFGDEKRPEEPVDWSA